MDEECEVKKWNDAKEKFSASRLSDLPRHLPEVEFGVTCHCSECVAERERVAAERARVAARADAYMESPDGVAAVEYLAALANEVDAAYAVRQTVEGFLKGAPGRVHCGDYTVIPTPCIADPFDHGYYVNAIHKVTGWPKYLIASAEDAADECLTEEQRADVLHIVANATDAFLLAEDEIGHDLRPFGLDAFAFRRFKRNFD